MKNQENDQETRSGLLREGSLAEQIGEVLRKFARDPHASRPSGQEKALSRLAKLSWQQPMPPDRRVAFLQWQNGGLQTEIISKWKYGVQAFLALKFASLKALPAKIVSWGAKAPRMNFFRSGRYSDQLRLTILKPSPPAAEQAQALPEAQSLRLETKQDDAVAEIFPAEENLPATPETIELWRYEIAMGRDFMKNNFLNQEGNEPDVPYSIPAFFPTHQLINITLDEGQWLDEKPEGEWSHKRIATKPVDL